VVPCRGSLKYKIIGSQPFLVGGLLRMKNSFGGTLKLGNIGKYQNFI
jgi:hypothetical protein